MLVAVRAVLLIAVGLVFRFVAATAAYGCGFASMRAGTALTNKKGQQ